MSEDGGIPNDLTLKIVEELSAVKTNTANILTTLKDNARRFESLEDRMSKGEVMDGIHTEQIKELFDQVKEQAQTIQKQGETIKAQKEVIDQNSFKIKMWAGIAGVAGTGLWIILTEFIIPILQGS